MSDTPLPTLTAKDFTTDQDVRWCPGCGDYAILQAVRKTLPTLERAKEDFVFISGIGCAARFPYYVEAYGAHTIHGRAPAFASGVKFANPDLSVWVVSGDGDLLSIGGNHTIHTMRRNVDLNILLLNNQICGLTKGQYSPTSEQGKVTKSTPLGSIDTPLNPIALAVASGCTFVGRCIDIDVKFLTTLMQRAANHRGTSFVEVYQDCNVFNHQVWFYASQKDTRPEHTVMLEHGKPLIFGADSDKGIKRSGTKLEIVTLGDGVDEGELLIHDETDRAQAFLLSQLFHPEFPEPVGVFLAIEGQPTYEDLLHEQTVTARDRYGEPDLTKLLAGAETWTVD